MHAGGMWAIISASSGWPPLGYALTAYHLQSSQPDVTGDHHQAHRTSGDDGQDQLLGPSQGRRTSGSFEKPGETAGAFLQECVRPLAQVVTCGADELACKPDPVHRAPCGVRPAVIHLGLPLPAGSSGLPAGIGRAALDRLRSAPNPARLLALLRVGFTEPSRSPGTLVVSYTTVSPLPRSRGAVCFLWHCPAGHPGLPLATTLP